MRYIAIIVVVAIIVVGILIGLLIQRLKNRQGEELDRLRGELGLVRNQLNVTVLALRTIRDLQGDSSFDAAMALDKVNQLFEEHYNQEGITR